MFQKQVYRVIVKFLLIDIEVKVKLPRRYWLRHLPISVRKCDAQLDYLQNVYVCFNATVFPLLTRPLRVVGLNYGSWELSIHSYERILVEKGSDFVKFFFEVVHPHVFDALVHRIIFF